MTRINCVPPSELSGKHLVAEYRELPRIFTLSQSMAERGEAPPDAAAPYRLGSGHMKSFSGRLHYLDARFDALVIEMLRRGYHPAFRELPDTVNQIPEAYWHDWEPTEADKALCRGRLRERMPNAYAADRSFKAGLDPVPMF